MVNCFRLIRLKIESHSTAGPLDNYHDAQVFAPFEEPICRLRQVELEQMLSQPLVVKVPARPGHALTCPLLLQSSSSPLPSLLESHITSALGKALPASDASENVWSSFWDMMVGNIVEAAAAACGLPLVLNRNVQDSTITLGSARRDLYVLLSSRVIVHGEEKRDDINLAKIDLRDKHKESSTYVYGGLEFCIGIAAGMHPEFTHSSCPYGLVLSGTRR